MSLRACGSVGGIFPLLKNSMVYMSTKVLYRFSAKLTANFSIQTSRLFSLSSPLVRKMSSANGKKVFVTRSVPSAGIDILKSSGCLVTQWNKDDKIPRDEFLKGVKGCDGIFCLLTDRVDKELLNSAGNYICYIF